MTLITGISSAARAASHAAHVDVEVRSVEAHTDAAGSPVALDLERIQAIALERHPSLTSARAAVARARADLKEAGFLPNPWISVEGEEIPDSWDFGAGLITSMINTSLITGGKRGFRVRAARTGVDRAGLLYEQQALEVLQNARKAYFEVLGAERKIKVADELAELTEDFNRRVGIRVEEGEARPLEADRTIVLAAQAAFEVRRARADLIAARQGLATSLGLPGTELGAVTGQLEPPGQFPEYEVLHDRALREAPSLRVPALEEEIGRHNLRLGRAQRVPDIEVGVGVAHQRSDEIEHDLRGFQLSVPLQVFNHGQATRARAKADIADARGKQIGARQSLEARLKQAYQTASATLDQIQTYQDRILPAARRAVSRTREGYEAGEFSYLDVLDAQRSLVSVNQTYVEALLEHRRARVDIEAAIAGDLETMEKHDSKVHGKDRKEEP